MKVVWTHQARERLFEIEDYIITQGSPENAAQFIQKLVDRTKVLADFPTSGRKVPEFDDINCRELIEGNYRIVYRLKPDVIEIETIFEARRIFPKTD